jgi:hypothetical protein
MRNHSGTFGAYAAGSTLVGLAMYFGHRWPGGTMFISLGLGCCALSVQYWIQERKTQ